MAIKQVNYDGKTIYIEDEISEEEKGYFIKSVESEKELDATKEFKPIGKDYDLDDTIIIEKGLDHQDE